MNASQAQDGFAGKLEAIRAELSAQGTRVLVICEAGFDAFFADDVDAAKTAIDLDDPIDRADVELENACVELLCDASREQRELAPAQLREVLVAAKANNELERIADCAVTIAEQVVRREGAELPNTLRVLANSVLGVVRDAQTCLDDRDADLAKQVLRSEDTILGFKQAVRDAAEKAIAAGTMTVQTGFVLHELASACEHMADHATNIAEQVLYAVTGTIVRHCETGWIEINL
ncbi:MAG: PhoU domain-containing protein [Planctomycetota bacterium]